MLLIADTAGSGQYGLLAHTAACLLLRLYDHITTRMPSCDDRARARDAPFPVVMVVVRDAQTLYRTLLTACLGRRRRVIFDGLGHIPSGAAGYALSSRCTCEALCIMAVRPRRPCLHRYRTYSTFCIARDRLLFVKLAYRRRWTARVALVCAASSRDGSGVRVCAVVFVRLRVCGRVR